MKSYKMFPVLAPQFLNTILFPADTIYSLDIFSKWYKNRRKKMFTWYLKTLKNIFLYHFGVLSVRRPADDQIRLLVFFVKKYFIVRYLFLSCMTSWPDTSSELRKFLSYVRFLWSSRINPNYFYLIFYSNKLSFYNQKRKIIFWKSSINFIEAFPVAHIHKKKAYFNLSLTLNTHLLKCPSKN